MYRINHVSNRISKVKEARFSELGLRAFRSVEIAAFTLNTSSPTALSAMQSNTTGKAGGLKW